MGRRIRRAAVLGAGVMGAGIAAHLANAGIPVLLLDLDNRLAEEGKGRLLKQKPEPLYEPRRIEWIATGNFADDLPRLGEADWIIEAVVEDLQVKRDLLAKVDRHRRPGTIVSTNTSGLSISAMAEGRSEDFRRHFLGTHFFNPPRYLKLLELIPHGETDPEVVAFMRDFAEKALGKGVVLCKDTPNFVANRIGTYGLMVTVQEMLQGGYGVDEVDAVTGPAMGRPKSATFRTLDVVGLDTFIRVAENISARAEDPEERQVLAVPKFMKEMAARGWLGSKSGQGFYKQERTAGGREILVLDLKTFTYRPRKKLNAPSLMAAKAAQDPGARLRVLLASRDRAGLLAWSILKKTLLYAAEKAFVIACDLQSVDRAMRWGFGWELGPFEIWDAIGFEKACARMKEEGEALPGWIEGMLAEGKGSFYRKENGKRFQYLRGAYRQVEERPEAISLQRLKEEGKEIRKNGGASLIDLGEGVACLEFHSAGNAIGVDAIQMLDFALEEVEKNYLGLVIGNQGKNFSAGANLMLLLMEAQAENWEEIDTMVRRFQEANLRIKYFSRPVVAAPFGMTLGGGYELAASAARMQAAAETYMGLVETSVGLIPGGGGTKELLLRFLERVPAGSGLDAQPLVSQAFETIAMAKVSSSAPDAVRLGYLRNTDRISINPDFLLHEAKRSVLELAERGYRPPLPPRIKVVGEPGYAAMKLGAYTYRLRGLISEHDEKIAGKLAYVLAGGNLPAGTEVTEQYLLDLEREAFLSLVGEPKTQARMQHMLVAGKPLRN